jgi:glycosyltransferase involved in cell wall biosynthesis
MYELISMRRPTLMSRTRSVEKYFDDRCFAWFESGNVADLADAIRRLHDDRPWGEELVEQARRRNEPYRWVHQREHYLRIVRRMLSDNGDGREHRG